MRGFICLATLLCLLLCGCGQEQNECAIDAEQTELETFSYTQHCIEFADQKVSIRETQGQNMQLIKTADDAVAIAKKYCLINNAETMVEYDPLTGVYCVVFIPVFEIDGNTLYNTDSQTVHVYVNKDGIALMTILVG